MRVVVCLCVLALGLPPAGRGVAAMADRLPERIARANAAVARALVTKDAAALSAYFSPNALSLPDYQRTLTGRDAIRHYYQELLRRRTITAYARTTTELLRADQRIFERGLFTMTYQEPAGEQPQRLQGKYVNIWALGAHGDLRLQAESYGYFRPVANPAALVVPGLPRATPPAIRTAGLPQTSLQFQLRALNALMEKAVQQRDGNLRADFFTPDAIFMPFADTLKVGMRVLRPYLIHYNSYPVTIDSIGISNQGAEEAGRFVIEYPVFRVQWHDATTRGRGSGKGIRIWRREADHGLKIYREIGVHDYVD